MDHENKNPLNSNDPTDINPLLAGVDPAVFGNQASPNQDFDIESLHPGIHPRRGHVVRASVGLDYIKKEHTPRPDIEPRFEPTTPEPEEIRFEGREVEPLNLSLNGLKRAIASRRLRRAERLVHELPITERVSSAVARAALDDKLPKPHLIAVTRAEQATQYRTSRRRNKVARKRLQQWRRGATLGASNAQGEPLNPTNRVVVEAVNGKVQVRPRSFHNDLGTDEQLRRLETGRYPRGRAKAERKAHKEYNKLQKSIDRGSANIQGSINKLDIPNQIRGVRLQRAQNRIDKLERRLDTLERERLEILLKPKKVKKLREVLQREIASHMNLLAPGLTPDVLNQEHARTVWKARRQIVPEYLGMTLEETRDEGRLPRNILNRLVAMLNMPHKEFEELLKRSSRKRS